MFVNPTTPHEVLITIFYVVLKTFFGVLRREESCKGILGVDCWAFEDSSSIKEN